MENIDMEQPSQDVMVKTAVGVAGGAALFSPVGMPIVHGLAGLAVAGLGIFAAGTLVVKAAEAITGGLDHLKPPKEDDSPFL
jgi:divalent metal cation (Fe/Co/Zn/Cd) transporter